MQTPVSPTNFASSHQRTKPGPSALVRRVFLFVSLFPFSKTAQSQRPDLITENSLITSSVMPSKQFDYSFQIVLPRYTQESRLIGDVITPLDSRRQLPRSHLFIHNPTCRLNQKYQSQGDWRPSEAQDKSPTKKSARQKRGRE